MGRTVRNVCFGAVSKRVVVVVVEMLHNGCQVRNEAVNAVVELIIYVGMCAPVMNAEMLANN